MKTRKAKVLIVDDHPLFLDGIATLLHHLLHPAEILVASSGQEALQISTTCSDIDWIFLDYHLPDTDGIALLHILKNHNIVAPVILMSGAEKVAIVAEALELGVGGFVAKSAPRDEYLKCLNTIENGGIYLSGDMEIQIRCFRTTMQAERKRITTQISKRQTEVLLLLSAGYSNIEIANALGISRHTVKDHVSSIMQLLHADNRVHCIAEARDLGLIN